MSAIFDGKRFEGPNPIDGEGTPDSPGVYLICTDSAGGEKIIGLYQSDNMREHMRNNPERKDWEPHVANEGFGRSSLHSFFIVIEKESDRLSMIYGIVDRRPYRIPCYRPPADDF